MRKDRFAPRGTRISHAQQHLCSLGEQKASPNVQREQSDVLDTNAKLFDKLESFKRNGSVRIISKLKFQ